MPALQTLLAPQVLTEVVSQVAASSDWLANLFGVAPGGRNVLNYGHGREGAYHVYNHVRKVAKGRAPGMSAGTRGAQGIGRVSFTYPRMFDSVSLLAETLHNLGRIDNPAVRDTAGANMISLQTKTLGELAANWRKAQIMGALRDSLYVGVSGDDEYFSLSSSNTLARINFQMPSGNKSQLNMLGDGNIIDASWAVNNTNIPLHLGKINAAFQRLCGGHLAACVCDATTWNRVITNDVVAETHGTANQPFRVLERDELDPVLGNTMKNVYRARLNVYPDIIWYITDEGLEIGKPGSETFEKIVEPNKVAFIGFEPGDPTLACYEGSEPVAEYDGAAETLKVGLSSWAVKRANPTQTELFVLDNALIVNHIPNSIAYGTVIF